MKPPFSKPKRSARDGNDPRKGSWRGPSPALVLSVVAIFLALGGTATALRGVNSVRSNDIAKKAVKNRHLAAHAVSGTKVAPNTVSPFKTNLTLFRATMGEASTTSNVPVDLGGPAVSVKVPKGALIAVYAEVEMRATGGSGNRAEVSLYEPTLLPKPSRILGGSHSGFRIRRTTPGPGSTDADMGVTSKTRAGWIVLASNPGVKTFALRYKTTGGTAIFKARKLWVSIIS